MKGTVTTLRRNILLALLVCMGLGISGAKAQNFAYYLGLSGGPNYTFLTSDIGEYKGKLGVHMGLVNEFRFAQQKFAISLETIYTTINADRKYTDSVPLYDRFWKYTYDQTDHYTYMQASVLFKYNFNLGGPAIIPYDRPDNPSRVQFGVYAGPYISHLAFFSWSSFEREGKLTRMEVTNQGDTTDKGTIVKGDFKLPGVKDSVINPTDIGVTVGTEMSFRIGRKVMVHVGLRYSRGLMSLDAGGLERYNTYGRDVFSTNALGVNTVKYQPAAIYTNSLGLDVGIKYRIAASF